MCGCRYRPQSVRRKPADISIRVELPPSPAFCRFLINADPLAAQGFGIHGAVRTRFRPNGKTVCRHLQHLALDEARGFDPALIVQCGQVQTNGMQTAVE